MKYFLYILYSKNLDRFYVGSTQDVEERLQKHLLNHKGYTGKAKDWIIVYTEKFESKTKALHREKQFKRWKSRKKIIQIIKETKHPDF